MLTPSRFRPAQGVDQSALKENKDIIEEVNRRGFLRGGISLGALTMLTGCDVTNKSSVQKALRAMSSWNDRVAALIFNPDHLAPTYTEAEVVNPPRFNAFYKIEQVKPVDVAGWTLDVSGLAQDKTSWNAQRFAAMPEQEIIIRHVCVEGWDYIGQWSGVNMKVFLEQIGADLTARYIGFRCADEYTSSIDMATALHPQTILATKYARQPLADPFGSPLRLRTSTKLGFKNPKWITAIYVTNVYPGGYWEDRGYNWFSGI
jgi:DMSO/TMAO reductase YedYZ molybdopterin-dependent catalytic subunit